MDNGKQYPGKLSINLTLGIIYEHTWENGPRPATRVNNLIIVGCCMSKVMCLLFSNITHYSILTCLFS